MGSHATQAAAGGNQLARGQTHPAFCMTPYPGCPQQQQPQLGDVSHVPFMSHSPAWQVMVGISQGCQGSCQCGPVREDDTAAG